MFLEIRQKGGRPYGVFRSSYRKDGKVLHKNHSTLWDVPIETLKLIQLSLQKKTIPIEDNFKLLGSKEYGASSAFLSLARQIGLDKVIYSRTSEQWVKDVLAMIVGRIVFGGSKLALSHMYKDSALWQLCGVNGKVDVEKHCYDSMDRLLERQEPIQKQLASKHFSNRKLILYDITSSYMEGEYKNSDLVYFGHNRDKKKGHEQICIGLLCNDQGCPVAVEVFPGNTNDSTTVINKIKEIKDKYNLDEIIFVGDRGMITSVNYDSISQDPGVYTITALTHRQIDELLNKNVIQLGLFNKENIVEISDPENPSLRYCLCCNPVMAEKETRTRRAILASIGSKLDKSASAKKRRKPEVIGKGVGKIFAKTNMEQFINWSVSDGYLHWSFNEEKISEAEKLDGCYIVFTNAPVEYVKKNDVVHSYKKLQTVEQAFRQLKTVLLEIRPVYHKNDERIKAHVFLCMLSYYLLWHIRQKTNILLQKEGNKGKYRYWTVDKIIDRLKSIRLQDAMIQGVKISKITDPDEEQEQILKLLEVNL